MKARQYDRRILTRGIEPNVYAVQESNGINRGQLKYFGTGLTDAEKNAAVSQMEGLLNTLNDAKEYGSLLNVEDYDWELLEKFVENTDTESQISFDTYGLDDTAEQLKQLIRIGKVMAQKYEVVATNPPYAGTSNLSAKVNDFVKKNYPDSKADLFAVFIERCGEMIKKNGYQAMITQHSWMFLYSYEKLREKLLYKKLINLVHLGAHAFDEINGEVVQTSSFVFCNDNEEKYKSTFLQLVSGKNEDAKATLFLSGNCRFYKTNIQIGEIKGTPYTSYWASDIVLSAFKTAKLLGEISEPRVGMATANNDRFVRLWFEISIGKLGLNLLSRENAIESGKKWFPFAKGGEQRKWYGNNDTIVNWENDGFEIQNFKDEKTGRIRSHNYNLDYIFRSALTWTVIGTQKTTFRFCPIGFLYSNSGYGMFCDNEATKYYLLGFMNSKVAMSLLNILSPSMGFESGYLRKLPIIDSSYKDEVVNKVKKCINESNVDWDSFETSWDFKRHPLITVISQNRALFDDITDIDLAECYTCWENECNERFNQLKANEEELNRIFIDIYGLQDELTPEVEDKDVTVRKADLQRDIKSLISYAVGCMFGRYSLDEEGLVLAGQPFESHFFEASAPRCGTGFAGAPGASVPIGEFYYKTDDGVKKCTYNPDKDNIIPICDEEYFSDDIVSRFCEWVKIVYGEKSLETNLDFIAEALGNKGNTSREVIRNYFLNDFFKDHCNTYSVTGSGKRPIYWLFDSGKQNGFKALIYMHRYDADTVGRVRTDYLHKAQKYVETAMQSAQYTIDNATSASEKSRATKAVTKYTKQLAEMKIYDEAIAHVANQRIEIDLDDGVKVNYAKFQDVEVAQEGKKALKIDLLAKI